MIPKNFIYKNKKKSLVVRGKLGTSKRPRLSVYRSNRYLYAQLIDDVKGLTLASVSEKDFKKEEIKSLKPSEIAQKIGELMAQKAVKVKIKNAIFDRRRYQYHGRIKNIAEGARAGGLKI